VSGQDRKKYETATTLDQALLDWCQDNLENRLEATVDITYPGGTIHASDRNKYVVNAGVGTFYEALTVFPTITRTVGEWLTPELQFSTLSLELSNADGRFNAYLPGGASYAPWVNKGIAVKVGLAEQGATYSRIFKGTITTVAGTGRTVKSINLVARDDQDAYNQKLPTTALTAGAYANIEDSNAGKLLPVIYGDWTTALDPDPAAVPAFVVNGKDPNVVGGTRTNVQLVICDHNLRSLDTSNVYLRRGGVFYLAPSGEIASVGAGNRSFQVKQTPAGTWIDGAPFEFAAGDEFFVRVLGKDIGSSYNDNAVWQARDILMTYGGMGSGDFNANWATFRDKATPAQSAISTIKSRVWRQEQIGAVSFALSLLEQVRLEAAFNRNQLFKINSLHFEDWVSAPSYSVKNWDVAAETFRLSIDERNNFNRARGSFGYLPSRNENVRATRIQNNAASVTQIGKAISKDIEFPNLYVEADVKAQLVEILRLSSCFFEIVDCELTWRALLLDLGDFVALNVQIGSTIFSGVPAMIRDLGYNPQGFKLPVKLWCFAMCPFPGYTPGYAGTVGGYAATITEE
jgi:hypothetical protein